MPERPYTLAEAVGLGWRPKKVTTRRIFDCQAGCGRQIVTDRADRVVFYLCQACRASFTGYLRNNRRGKGSPPDASPTNPSRGPSTNGQADTASNAGDSAQSREVNQ